MNDAALAELVEQFRDLVDAGLKGNGRRIRLIAASAARTIRGHSEKEADAIHAILAKSGDGTLRHLQFEPPPIDADSGAPLLSVSFLSEMPQPVLESNQMKVVERFVRERQNASKLEDAGFAPPRSLLLLGPPGTGKTMLARWLAQQLRLKFASLDLASSISSFLGKTGINLRKTLDYARATPSLLLLDEFDSIAKRRDDSSDVGELKRIVTVLLKELETWPSHSVLVAATNHPELLDPAMTRRFDVVLKTQLPGATERGIILKSALGNLADRLPSPFVDVIGDALETFSGSDVQNFGESVARRSIVENSELERVCVSELGERMERLGGKKAVKTLIGKLKALEMTGFSVRELAEIFSVSPSMVQYQTKKTREVCRVKIDD